MIDGLPAVKVMDDTRLPLDLSTKGMNVNSWHEENALLTPIWKELSLVKKIGIKEYVKEYIFDGNVLRMPNECDTGKGKGDGLSYLCKEFLFKEIKPNVQVLEVGCGRGQAGIWFASAGLNYTGIDASMSNIGFSLMLNQGLLELQISFPEYRQMLAEKLDFPDKSFDIVYTNHAMEHFHNLDKALEEMFRVGRKVCGVVALPEEIECGQHMYKIDYDLLRRYLEIGCSSFIIEVREKETVYWGDIK